MSELYLELVEQCNMSCAHCCFSAKKQKGAVMSKRVFDRALKVAREREVGMTFGGGEPTLHPHLLEWVMEAAIGLIEVSLEIEAPSVLVVTNGKATGVATKLAKMAHLGICVAEVSQDPWHDPIDFAVVDEFTRFKKRAYPEKEGFRSWAGVRDVSYGVTNKGRAAENSLGVRSSCPCYTPFVTAAGDVYQCGCRVTRQGTIFEPLPEAIFSGECELEN